MGWIAPLAGITGDLVGGIQSRNAAQNAAQAQIKFAQEAQQLEQQNQQSGLNFQNNEWTNEQNALAPFLAGGTSGIENLTALLSTPGSGLLTPWSSTFTAPTLAQAEQYPGYQFQLQQGEGALQNSAAARGGLESGNTQEALGNYAQNFAQTDYSNIYNQALQQYQMGYGQFQQNQQNEYSRLMGLSGYGPTSTAQMGTYGQAAANNMTNLYLTGGMQQAQQLNNQGSATAAGDIGSAQAWNNMISGMEGWLSPMSMMGQGGGMGGMGMGGGGG